MQNNDTLFLCTPTPLVYPSLHIGEFSKIESTQLNEFNEIHVNKNEKLITTGDFNNFHIYMIITHSKFSILPNSIIIDTNGFSATIELLDIKKQIEINFNFPKEFLILDWDKPVEITPTSYTQNEILDGFIFQQNNKEIKLVFDLHFITHYSTNFLDFKIPLTIKYIGIAEKENKEHKKRTALERLGKGHEKLQVILAKLQKTPNLNCSICLLRFKEDELNPILNFSNTIKTIEASLISFFRTDEYNDHRLYFPNKSNLKRTKSLEYIIHSKKILHIITFLAPPKNCSFFSEYTINNNISKNIDNQQNEQINNLFEMNEDFEYAIHINMETLCCDAWNFQP